MEEKEMVDRSKYYARINAIIDKAEEKWSLEEIAKKMQKTFERPLCQCGNELDTSDGQQMIAKMCQLCLDNAQ
jgi:hypothetical protein